MFVTPRRGWTPGHTIYLQQNQLLHGAFQELSWRAWRASLHYQAYYYPAVTSLNLRTRPSALWWVSVIRASRPLVAGRHSSCSFNDDHVTDTYTSYVLFLSLLQSKEIILFSIKAKTRQQDAVLVSIVFYSTSQRTCSVGGPLKSSWWG